MKNILPARFSSVLLASLLALSLGGCQRSRPRFVYAPDMHYSPATKAQEEGGTMLPPAGTIPRRASAEFLKYEYKHLTPDQAGKLNQNPLPRTKENLLLGKAAYSNMCQVCHGPLGEGNGPVVGKFPAPPSLQSERALSYSDGHIFHIATHGQNLMTGYEAYLYPKERWAVVHYIRALQRAQNPTSEDLKILEERNR